MSKFSLNTLMKRKNEFKTWLVVSVFVFILLMLLVGIMLAKHPRKQPIVSKTMAPKVEPFEQIAEFNESATGQAIGSLQTEQSTSDSRMSKIESDNQKLIVQNQQFLSQLDAMSKLATDLKSKMAERQSKPVVKSMGSNAAPQVLNGANTTPSNLDALGGVDASSPQPLRQSSGISAFNFSYHPLDNDQNTQDCMPGHCVLPGTFAKAVLLGAADANASVNGQSNTTPILFRILEDGVLPNGYHTHLKGCFVVGEVYGDISSERGEVKLAQISCVLDGKTMTQSINGTAYFLGKEGIRGNPVMRNGQLLWNAGVAGMLNGLAQGVQQAATTQSLSPLGQTSTVSPSKIEMSMGAGGVQSAANTLANYYVKRADQYHPIIELNAGTVVNLVFLNKFLLTGDQQSNGAQVTKLQSNAYWQSGDHEDQADEQEKNNKNNLSDYDYGDAVSHDHINPIQQQINALGAHHD